MPTILITGTSSGFGRAIALAALAHGDKVIATARNAAKLSDLASRGAQTISLDITAPQAEVTKIVNEAVKQSGGVIDILINNAGYVLIGAIEEISDEEAQAQFSTNVFGHLKVTRAVLPFMRAQKSGVVGFIGSVAGWHGEAGIGLYDASKFALAGIVEAFRLEVAHLNITATLIEPGYFRTNLLEKGAQIVAKKEIDDLKEVMDGVKDFLGKASLHQPGDPEKGAKLIIEALTGTDRCVGKALPNRLLLGRDCVQIVREVTERHLREVKEWEELSSQTDCDDVVA